MGRVTKAKRKKAASAYDGLTDISKALLAERVLCLAILAAVRKHLGGTFGRQEEDVNICSFRNICINHLLRCYLAGLAVVSRT